MPDVLLRWARVEDFSEIASLDRISWMGNRNSEFIPDGEHVWRIWIEHAYVGVAVSFPSTQTKLHFVHKIFIAAEYRENGLGKKLMKIICSKYDENGITAHLTIDTNNIAMQRLAESMGFSEKELINSYYRKNEDRWVYKRVPHL